MAQRDFHQETLAKDSQEKAFRKWIQVRAEAIRSRVSVYDVLNRQGVVLKSGNPEQQISCPFHGTDNRPSARIYPETVRGPSHVWCFVCQERWDAIGLWRKYSGEDQKFTRILTELERTFGIIAPETPPPTKYEEEDSIDPDMLEVDRLFDACEARLKGARESFDMEGFLMIGSVLDRLDHQVNEQQTSFPQAKVLLNSVLQKIGAKVRG